MADRYQHHECDKAITEDRPDDACEGCRGIPQWPRGLDLYAVSLDIEPGPGGGHVESVRRHGKELTPDEVAAFEADEDDDEDDL